MGTHQKADGKFLSAKHFKTTHSISSIQINNYEENNVNSVGIECLPVEILVEIFSHLQPQDLHALERVSEFFARIVRDPRVWKTYQVEENDPATCVVIEKLKRMPLLEAITIHARPDCDDILCQLSRSNQRLKKLCIIDCTGSTGRLYLQSSYLTRILERCNRLHTIQILGSRFRGKKFYSLLGDMNTRLKTLYINATSSQFRAFTKHASHLNNYKEIMYSMCRGTKTWAPLRYIFIESNDTKNHQVGVKKIKWKVFVRYLHNTFLFVNLNDSDRQNSNLRNCP